jgi:3-deoxy-D-manno-octulosonic-acid transferase
MILLIYRALGFIAYLLLSFLALFSYQIRSFLKKRKFVLETPFDLSGKTVYWLHGASVGELDQCKALTNVILEQDNRAFIIQSVFSESVTQANLDNTKANFTFYLPLDVYGAYNQVFEKFQPKYLLIAAWDTWTNLILKAKQSNTKVYLFCATLSKNSGRYKNKFSLSLLRTVISSIDGISTTHPIYNDIFTELTQGSSVSVESCGDSRFDSVIDKINCLDKASEPYLTLQKLKKRPLIILGSTYFPCEEIWFPLIPSLLQKGYDIWIFPHKVNSDRIEEVKEALEKWNIQYQQYSLLDPSIETNVVVFDAMGILAFAYQFSNIVYVGGAIHNRVHNVIEPAYFGNIIITGQKIQNASEAILLHRLQGLYIIQNSEEILSLLEQLEREPKQWKQKQDEISNFVKSNSGSSKRFYEQFIL